MKVEMQDNTLSLRLDGVKEGWERYVMLVSDQHHDSPFCDKRTEKAHLDKALERDAIILMGGDTFDAMQGKHDPRASYDHLDPYLKKDNYFDAVVDFNADFYKAYADNIVMIAKGNHEVSVMKHHNISLIDRLVEKIGGRVIVGGYGGWIRFMFTVHKTRRVSFNLKYFHGAGGEAPVTKGVIQTARQAVYLPDADVVWNGHNHNQYVLPMARERLTQQGKIYKDVLWFVRTPGYHDAYADGAGGWEVEKGFAPKPMGCVWLRFYMENGTIGIVAEQDIR